MLRTELEAMEVQKRPKTSEGTVGKTRLVIEGDKTVRK